MEEFRYLTLQLLRLPCNSVLKRRRLCGIFRTIEQTRRRFIKSVRQIFEWSIIRIFYLHVAYFLLGNHPSHMLLHLVWTIVVGLWITLIRFWCVNLASHWVMHRYVVTSRTTLCLLVWRINYMLELICVMNLCLVIFDCDINVLGALRIIIIVFIIVWLGLDVPILGLRLFILFHDDCSM